MITITMNDDYTLTTSNGNIISAQYSANISFHLEVPEAYKDSLIVPGYVYYDGAKKVESAIDNYADGNFTVPANAFSKEGILGIAFAITTGEETITTTIAEFEIRGSVNTSFSLPTEILWQTMLQNFMDQYMDKVYTPIMTNLIDKTEKLQSDTAELQKTVNGLIKTVNDLVADVNKKLDDGDFTLDFKWEGTKLFIKKHTDDWSDGVDLSGATTITLDNEVQNTLKLSSERSNKDKIFVQLLDSDGNPIMIETDSSNIYKKSKDGTSEITLDVLDTTLAKLINSISFFDVNPIPLLTELSKYLDIE